MPKFLPIFAFWCNKSNVTKKELSSNEIHQLFVKGDFCNPYSELHPYLNSEQFVLNHTFTVRGFKIWHILANLKQQEYIRLLSDLLKRYHCGITPESLNCKAGNGFTPCHEAAFSGNLEALKLLVEYGANPTIRGPEGLTPLELAKRQHFENSDFIRGIENIVAHYTKVNQSTSLKEEPLATIRKRYNYKPQSTELIIDIIPPAPTVTHNITNKIF